MHYWLAFLHTHKGLIYYQTHSVITSYQTNTYTIITLDRPRNYISILTELREILSESQRRQIMEQVTWRSERVKIVCYFQKETEINTT